MDWESINGITGIVSAIGAIVSVVQIYNRESKANTNSDRILMFLLASFSWALMVIFANWLFEPMGSYLYPNEERKVFAVALGFPAVVGFYFAVTNLFAKTR